LPANLPSGIVHRSAAELLNRPVLEHLLCNNVPPQQVKDLLMCKTLERGPGIACDLKLYWSPGRTLPKLKSPVLLATELAIDGCFCPTTRAVPSRYFDTPCRAQPWLGFMARTGWGDDGFFRQFGGPHLRFLGRTRREDPIQEDGTPRLGHSAAGVDG